jgi:alpha-ketoglutarate-dependent taurine dioxygenase
MTLGVRPLSPALGVEVMLDLERHLDDAALGEIHALFRAHRLLLFRGQALSEATQVRFSTSFGPISRRSPAMRDRDTVNVSNTDPAGVLGTGELLFHSDNTFFAEPLQAIGLYAIEVPEAGGDTLFANAQAAYAALPQAVRARIAALTSFQLFDYASPDYNKRPRLETAAPDAPRARHPLVWTEPETGTPTLFFSEQTTACIEGLEPAEEAALIATLRAAIADPAHGYRHRWRPGDFLFWDNVVLQHARTDFDPKAPRTLRRTPILERPGAGRFTTG